MPEPFGSPVTAGEPLSDSCKPRLALGVRMQTDAFVGRQILVSPEAVVELTGPGPAIIALCNGLRPLGEIVTILSERYNVPTDVLRADVIRYVERLREKRWLDILCGDTPVVAGDVAVPNSGTAVTARSAAAMASRPLGLIAEVTYQCPLHCPYCSNPTRYPHGEELTTDEWCRVVREAADIGVLHALFSGGEPLVRKDLETIVTTGREAGLYTNLITSAIGFTPQRARSLKAAGLDSIQISFQADEGPLGDLIAGAAAHARKIEAARLAREMGFPVTVNVVLHRANIDRIDRMISLAERLGARRLELANTQFYGWAFRNRDALLPTRPQIEAAERVASLASRRLKGVMDVLYILPDYFNDYPKPCMNGWGKRHIAVNPVGDVLPCPTAAEIAGLRFDNVREYHLDWIWAKSDAFNRFRGTDWMPEPCRSCDRREIDFGGCRCQAAILTGDASNTDPVCVLSPQHHLIANAHRDGVVSRCNEPIKRELSHGAIVERLTE